MNTDKVTIPVTVNTPELEKELKAAVDRISSKLRNELRKVATEAAKGEFPAGRPAVTGTEKFSAGGREFEIKARAFAKSTPKLVEGEGEDAILMFEGFTAAVKEVKTKIAKTVDADAKRLKDFKRSIQFQTPEVQEKAIQDYLQQFGDINNELNSKLERIGRAGQRSRFTETMKSIQTLDPADQIRELDRLIADPMNKFVNDMKIYRQRVARNMQNAARGAEMDRQRRFSNMTLVGSGVGLGLLGNAGFPLLNVGFAAMSGGLMGATVVGLATAIGESIRAIERLSQATQAAAREIGFVPTSLKRAEAQNKALEAFVGLGGLTARQIELEERLKFLQDKGGMAQDFNAIWNNVTGAGRQTGIRNLVPTSRNFLETWLSGIASGGALTFPSLLRQFTSEFTSQRAKTEKAFGPNLESAFRNAQLELMKPTVGIENDPYEVWKRIQTSALDPTKQAEMEIMRAQLRQLEELVNIERGKVGIPSGITSTRSERSFGVSGTW